MKGNNIFGVHFILRPNNNEDGKFSIYARVVVNGTRTEISIKAFVFPDDWNAGKVDAKAISKDLKGLKNYLEDVSGKLFTHYKFAKPKSCIYICNRMVS